MSHKKTWDFSDAPRVSKAEAKEQGLSQFFTGEACAQEHVAPRYANRGNCIVCNAEAVLAWQKKMYLNRGEDFRAYLRKQRAVNPVATLLRVAKSRAKRKNIEFSITVADLTMPERCPCCNTAMAMRTGPVKSGPTPQSPSIDRLDSAFGYVASNVAIICWRCNELKRNASLDELRKIVSWIERTTQTQKTKLSLVG